MLRGRLQSVHRPGLVKDELHLFPSSSLPTCQYFRNTSAAKSSTPLSAGSMTVSSNVWVALDASSNKRVVPWDFGLDIPGVAGNASNCLHSACNCQAAHVECACHLADTPVHLVYWSVVRVLRTEPQGSSVRRVRPARFMCLV
ncbi:hypothetical protein HGRIS_005490 [Hohenbuehelia grisea]|uniref:Uncharacterized protein n=1 Tax=Hohenbuehelia grisea TaxID=104357 RepID=A0ABR3JX52_9AGAR